MLHFGTQTSSGLAQKMAEPWSIAEQTDLGVHVHGSQDLQVIDALPGEYLDRWTVSRGGRAGVKFHVVAREDEMIILCS